MTTRRRRSSFAGCFLARRGGAAVLAAMLALATGAGDGAAATFEYDTHDREVRAKITPVRSGIGMCGISSSGPTVEEVIAASGSAPFDAEASVVGYGEFNVPPGTAIAQQDSVLAQSSIAVTGSLLSVATSYDYDELMCDWGAYEVHDLTTTFQVEFELSDPTDVVLDAQIDGTPNPPLCELYPQFPSVLQPCVIDVDVELRNAAGAQIAGLNPGQPPGHFALSLAAGTYTLIADAHTAPRSYTGFDVYVPGGVYEPTTFATYEVTLTAVGAVPALGVGGRIVLVVAVASIAAITRRTRSG